MPEGFNDIHSYSELRIELPEFDHDDSYCPFWVDMNGNKYSPGIITCPMDNIQLHTAKHDYDNQYVCRVCGKYNKYDILDIGPAGGYIFYDKGYYSDGWRYLEAAPADLRVVAGMPTVDASISGYSSATVGYVFGYFRTKDSGSNLYVNGTTTYNTSNCTGTAIGTGAMNTQLLVDAMGEQSYSSSSGSGKTGNYAARLCDILTYTVGGETFDDWFLPSKDELYFMYVNLHKKGLGGFTYSEVQDTIFYWSSSETNGVPGDSMVQSFRYGQQYTNSRFESNRVRPVRTI